MATTIGGWNLQEGLAVPSRAHDLLENILAHDNDVMFLSDAYWPGNPLHDIREEEAEEALDVLRGEGYDVTPVDYEEKALYSEHYMVMLSRMPVIGKEVLRLGCRNAVAIDIRDEDNDSPLRIVGAHFDDVSERSRVAQVADLTKHLGEREEPAALIGDLNSLHGNSRIARFLGQQLVGEVATHIPHPRARSIAGRMHEMGWGSALRILELSGLRDVDPGRTSSFMLDTNPRYTPSFPAKLPFMHLDRCFVSKDVASRDFSVAPYCGASDHRAIQVTIEA